MKNTTIYLAIILSIVLSSCKKDIEEKITKNITGEWLLKTKFNGDYNPYDRTEANSEHTISSGYFDDNCGNTFEVDYTKHLTHWFYKFEQAEKFTETKIYEIYTVDVQASWAAGCNNVIYKTVNDTVVSNSKWHLDGKNLTIESNPLALKVEEVNDNTLILSEPTMKGNERSDIVFEKI